MKAQSVVRVVFFACFVSVAVVLSCGSAAASPAISTGDGGWVWQNPLPIGNDFEGVTFVDGSRGWAVGGAGTILHTFDGGTTWYRQRAPLQGYFTDVTFRNPAEGWITGGGGTILHTENGGDKWVVQETPTKRELCGVAFATSSNGWAVGEGGVILRTDDGGATWHLAQFSFDMPYEYVRDVAFADAEHGWIVGDDVRWILNTNDGGSTWQRQATGLTKPDPDAHFDLLSITCVDPDHVWVAYNMGGVIATTNGGDSWKVQDVDQLGGWASSVAFVNVDRGWAMNGWGDIVTTVNGGTTWTSQDLPTYIDFGGINTGLCAVNEDRAWVAGSAGQLLGTVDGGQVWTPQSIGHTNVDGDGFNMWGIDFADAQHGIAVSQAGQSLWTEDGGATWSFPVGWGVPSWSMLTDVSMTSVTNACAVGEWGKIVTTTDGGRSWVERLGGGSVQYQGVDYVDADQGWAVGYDSSAYRGVVMKTTDGGASWLDMPLGTTADWLSFGDVDFIDAQHGWLVGENKNPATFGPFLLKTDDGGATWTPVPTGVSEYSGFQSASFVDAQHGWIAGATQVLVSPDFAETRGLVLRTTDGGTTWTSHVQQTEWLYDARFCDDALNGWAVGRFGALLNSTDGGETWNTQESGVSGEFFSVAVVDDKTAWVGGSCGLILHTANGGLPAPDDLPPVTTPEESVPSGWSRSPVPIALTATDDPPAATGLSSGRTGLLAAVPMPSGVQITGWAVDPPSTNPGRFRWHVGESLTITTEGAHKVYFRSVDNFGNPEKPRVASVRIDTRRPTPKAPFAATVRRGRTATLKYSVTDPRPGGPNATVTITIKDGAGVVVRSIVLTKRAVNRRLAYSFRCTLARGTYRFFIAATDAAGNVQTKVAANRLVVR